MIRINNKLIERREIVVGENDVDGLFIYSIDGLYPVYTVI